MAGPTRAVSATSSPPDDRLTCIVTWRQQRQRLQQNLQQTACRSLNDMSDQELEQRLGGLCNDLMDYLATSHGSIYTRCYRAERVQHPARNERSRLLKDIWLHLGRTTDAALGFNQRCETTSMEALQHRLHAELGKLNKMLCLRFALEEQLLELTAQAPATSEG
jgi:regulator of sigma D